MFVWFPNVLVNNKAISRTGPKTDVWQFYVLPRTKPSWETMTSISAGQIFLDILKKFDRKPEKRFQMFNMVKMPYK